jgi:thiol-disulfide isomerase/thioredoxin
MQYVAVLTFGVLSAAASAQLPDGTELIKSMDKAYESLSSFHFSGVRRTETKYAGATDTVETPCVFAWAKPSKARIELQQDELRLVGVSDGETMWGFLPDENIYVASAVPPLEPPNPEAANEPASSAFNPMDGVLSLVNELRTTFREAKGARVLRTERLKWNDSEKDVLVVEVDYRPKDAPKSFRISPTTLWVDPASKMVLKESVSIIPPSDDDDVEIVESFAFNKMSVNEKIAEAVFAFAPPEGATRVDELFPSGEEYPDLTGEEATNFELTDLANVGVQLEALRGKVVLLDFWASWCGPCREELPTIVALQQEFADKGLIVLGINDEPAEVAQQFLTDNQLALRSLVDAEGVVNRAYQIVAIPTVVVINREGVIAAHFVGVQDAETLRAAIVAAGIE